MSKHIPLGVVAVGFGALVISLLYATAASTHLGQLWLVPISLAFTGIGLLSVAAAIKLREHGTRLAALERQLQERQGAEG
jgi:hypothetical protein